MSQDSAIAHARSDVAMVYLSDRRRPDSASMRRLIIIGSLLAEAARKGDRDSEETRNAAALAELWELQLITARPELARMETER